MMDIMMYTEEMTQYNNRLIIIVIYLLIIYSFFGYLLPDPISYGILVFNAFCLSLFLIILNVERVPKRNFLVILLYIVFILTLLLPASYSLFPDSSLKISINRTLILTLGILLILHNNWQKRSILHFLLFVSIVHGVFTLFSYLMPSIFNGVVVPTLPSEISSEITKFMSYGVYPGITEQVGQNAFYISVGILISYCYLNIYRQNSGLFIWTFLTVLFLALLLTGKRGHLLATILSMLIIYVVYSKVLKRNVIFKIIQFSILLITLISLLIYLVPEASTPLMRLIESNEDDLTSGRIGLYINAIEIFKEKPILGWGTGVFHNLYGIGTHNIYLQLLCENGIIGFLIFMIIVILNLITCYKMISIANINDDRENALILFFSLGFQVFFLIYGLTGNPLSDGFIFIIYMISSAIPFAFSKKFFKENLSKDY